MPSVQFWETGNNHPQNADICIAKSDLADSNIQTRGLKMIQSIFVGSLLSCSIFLSGCVNTHHPEEPSKHAHSCTTDDAPSNLLEGISLNDGEKWAMDEHTRTVFAAMASSYLSSDHSSMDQNALKEAGANLQEHIRNLIRGCTMTGDAHNQLHIFLAGYMPAVNSLAEHGTSEDAQSVKHYLKGYDNYFE